jgi:choline kinase
LIIQNFILLAAGRGSRIAKLTANIPKSLLPIAGIPVLKHIIDNLMKIKNKEIVVVTGYRHLDVNSYLVNKYGNKIKIVFNEAYEKDTNILSVDLGVDALLNPESGYIIIETDIILEPKGWNQLFKQLNKSSAWVTFGLYSKILTGAAIHIDKNNSVLQIVYAPIYNKKYDGWVKLLGILIVGEKEVKRDRLLRKEAIRQKIDQYYMGPWVENLDQLPCKIIDLTSYYAGSFNDVISYRKLDDGYKEIVNEFGD